jgi:lycopene cyclase domain-containing protein
MIGEYTIAAVLAPVLVVGIELGVLRTGILVSGRYWATIAIVLAFQVPADGWLTHGEQPVVAYHRSAISGIYGPWHIPIEDFGFGFAMVTLTVALWRWYHDREQVPGD